MPTKNASLSAHEASYCKSRVQALVPYGYRKTMPVIGDVGLGPCVNAKITVERNESLEDYSTTTIRGLSYGASTQARAEQRQEVWGQAEDYLAVHKWV